MSDQPTVRLLVPQRVWSFIEGTQAYADYRSGTGQPDDAEASEVARILTEAPVTRKDRRFWIELTRRQAGILYSYVEVFQMGAQDNTWDEDGRADLFSANSFLAQLHKAGISLEDRDR